jgi:gamma-glutamylcyclotransferase (GGCT)/AIG2-like uncharacterized protein YtfP
MSATAVHHVFVYGTLRSDRPNHRWMKVLEERGRAHRVHVQPADDAEKIGGETGGASPLLWEHAPDAEDAQHGHHALVVFGPWRTPFLLHAEDVRRVETGTTGELAENQEKHEGLRETTIAVLGELWRVDARALEFLDVFENVPAAYERREVRVRPARARPAEEESVVTAFAYFRSRHTIEREHAELERLSSYPNDPQYTPPEDRPPEFRAHLERLRALQELL